MKIGFWCFQFWELSFSGIFVKLSKEWDPLVWLVPLHNVSLQPVLLFVSSPSSFFFFLLPRALSSHWPFIAPPQAATITPVVSIMSNHQVGPSFFLSLFPPFARSVSLSGVFSLSHPFCQIITIMSNHHKPLWDQFKLSPDRFISVSNFVIWIFNLRILSLGLLCLWFGFAMHSFGFFGWHQRESKTNLHVGEENRGFEKRRQTKPRWDRETRGLEIGSFANDISLYFAFAVIAAEVADVVVSLF